MSDEARHKGIRIDADKLAEKLGVPDIPVVARSGEGVKKLITTLLAMPIPQESKREDCGHPGHHPHVSRYSPKTPITEHFHLNRNGVWQRIGEIVEEAQTLGHHHPSLAERLEQISVHPLWGSFLHRLLIGTLIDGEIDFMQSFGGGASLPDQFLLRAFSA